MKVGAVIVAAGQGRRFGKAMPKQFFPLAGKPLLSWTLASFEKSQLIAEIVVVLPEDFAAFFEKLAKRCHKPCRVVTGGKERFDSVKAGLKALDPSCDYVAVHDGARPLVSPGIIDETVTAAKRYGAAIAAVPVKDTIKFSQKGKFIEKTVDRNHLWSAQTPQVFKRSWLEKAYHKRQTSSLTDEAQLFERNGKPVCLVFGSYENLKVTTPEDFIMAEALLRKRRTQN